MYVEVIIDGLNSYISSFKTISTAKAEKGAPSLGWSFTTRHPISKGSKIEIIMLDWDEYGYDEEMAEWTLPNDKIGQTATLKSDQSEITIESQWL